MTIPVRLEGRETTIQVQGSAVIKENGISKRARSRVGSMPCFVVSNSMTVTLAYTRRHRCQLGGASDVRPCRAMRQLAIPTASDATASNVPIKSCVNET